MSDDGPRLPLPGTGGGEDEEAPARPPGGAAGRRRSPVSAVGALGTVGALAAAGLLGVVVGGSSDAPLGARIAGVIDGTPAGESGLQRGDVITAVNGAPVASADDLSRAIGGLAPGEWISLSFSGASGAYRSATLALDERGIV
ncbi:PDZ domain-containing protein [Microcella flavibacter]|uniref:PDZ domain-containing protein n=1 Tax=Microcella flavibacter TaxID=1804990 RepID=UPI0014569F4D|nr:PDZ domain-containing protein [Microcella flavibacter]